MAWQAHDNAGLFSRRVALHKADDTAFAARA